MQTLVKGLTALLIFGNFIAFNCESAQAAELPTNSVETQELARHHHYPPPPRHRHDRHRHHHDRYDDWGFNPPPHHSGHRPHHRW